MVTISWDAALEDIVLLDVTFQSGSSYAGFTFSPWFFWDIPHQDILFATNSATIEEAEEWKLESTLERTLKMFWINMVLLYLSSYISVVAQIR